VKEQPDDVAERIARRTHIIVSVSILAFLVWQAAFFLLYADAPPTGRTVDQVRALGFVAWCAALLLLIATGGGAFSRREVREVLDDELARARRATVYRNGFWAMIIVGLAGYALAHLTAISTLLLAHLTVSLGMLVATSTLAYLGRS
jgi:hypothetical protein